MTFTTAATAELRERIRKRLAELLAVYEQGPGADDLLNRLHAQYPDAASHRRLLLAAWLRRSGDLHHSRLRQRALQDAAFEAGGDFDNELTHDDRELLDALLADLWRHMSWRRPSVAGRRFWCSRKSPRRACASSCAITWANLTCSTTTAQPMLTV